MKALNEILRRNDLFGESTEIVRDSFQEGFYMILHESIDLTIDTGRLSKLTAVLQSNCDILTKTYAIDEYLQNTLEKPEVYKAINQYLIKTLGIIYVSVDAEKQAEMEWILEKWGIDERVVEGSFESQ